jgi:hypothetical protein
MGPATEQTEKRFHHGTHGTHGTHGRKKEEGRRRKNRKAKSIVFCLRGILARAERGPEQDTVLPLAIDRRCLLRHRNRNGKDPGARRQA